MLVPRLILGLAAYLSLAAASVQSPYAAGNCSKHDLSVLSCSAESLTTDTCSGTPDWARAILGPYTACGNDFCNGSYPSSCDNSRNYTGVASILEDYQQYSLLDYMREYWRNYPAVTTTNGTDEELWEHEWAKHGTCMTTLRPSCYTQYALRLELIDFIQEVVYLYKQLPTSDYLAACDIVPTNSTTYALADLEVCFMNATGGYLPHIGCTGSYLSEVWYYYNLAGRVKGGEYIPTNTTYGSNCPTTGILYPPKLSSS